VIDGEFLGFYCSLTRYLIGIGIVSVLHEFVHRTARLAFFLTPIHSKDRSLCSTNARESCKVRQGTWMVIYFMILRGTMGCQDPQPIYEVVSSITILALCLWICGLAWCEGWGHTSWKYATKIPSFRAHKTSHKWACVCSILTCTFNVVCSSF
jgi:hypothetical protein